MVSMRFGVSPPKNARIVSYRAYHTHVRCTAYSGFCGVAEHGCPSQNLAVSSSYDDRRVLVLPPQSRVSTQSAAYSRDVSGKGPSGRNWSALRMVQGCTKRISAPCGMDPAGNGSNTPGPGVGCTQVVEQF